MDSSDGVYKRRRQNETFIAIIDESIRRSVSNRYTHVRTVSHCALGLLIRPGGMLLRINDADINIRGVRSH